jgi:superfamily II DNA helicase RecQ
MKLSFFWIPAMNSTHAQAELNQFLGVHRVVQVDRTLCVADGQAPGWAVCVEWVPGSSASADTGSAKESSAGGSPPRVDYREALDEPTFRLFAALRTWRKETAAAQGVPIYTVATNEQLAAMARLRVRSLAEMEKVEGFGGARLAKYGQGLLAVCLKDKPSPDPV